MADNNNDYASKLPEQPNPALKKLEFLVGNWKSSGEYEGASSCEWMEGGFFLVQKFDGQTPTGRQIKGVEYIGFDEETQTLRSHLMDNHGANFAYTYDILEGEEDEDDTYMVWFGDKDSDMYYKATLSKDRNTITGRWYFPDWSYELNSSRL